eukprot:SAG11_NODE_134_length_15338_cov_3.876435_10_plen_64_part_00
MRARDGAHLEDRIHLRPVSKAAGITAELLPHKNGYASTKRWRSCRVVTAAVLTVPSGKEGAEA